MRLYRAKFNVGSLQVWRSDNSFTVSAYPISNAMRWRRETTHTAPRFFSRLPPHPLHPLSTSPNRPAQKAGGEDAYRFFCVGRLGEKEMGGCGRGGKKLLGPYV